jgi:DNA-directed RNA polymerase subunit F
MAAIGVNYVCPVNAKRGPDRCSTNPVNAERLAVQVVTQVLRRVMNDSTIALLTGDIQQTASEASGRQRERLQHSESSIEELNLLKGQVLQTVEQNLTTYPEVAEKVNEINAARTGLAYESQIAQEELDRLAFISNTEGIREDAQDIINDLKDVGPEETRELLNMSSDSDTEPAAEGLGPKQRSGVNGAVRRGHPANQAGSFGSRWVSRGHGGSPPSKR